MSRRGGYTVNKRVKKDYCGRQLANPFYRQPKPSNGYLKRYWRLLIILLVAVIIFCCWLFFASQAFIIKNVNVKGISRVSEAEIQQSLWSQADQRSMGVFSQHNLWLFKRDKISQALQEKYHFASVIIKKRLFHGLNIIIQERDYVFIWKEADRYYYLDAVGNLVDEIVAPQTTPTSDLSTTSSSSAPSLAEPQIPAGYPLIKNQGEYRIKDGRIDIPSSYFTCTQKLYEALGADKSLLKELVIDNEYNTLKAELTTGVFIYFNPPGDCDKQISNLMVLLKGDYRDKVKKKVDLRYGDKIFYE